MKGQYFIGVDGGGTKTAVAIATLNDTPIISTLKQGCSYQTLGVSGAVEVVCKGIHDILEKQSASITECVACCIGMPCYGENAEKDREILELFQQKLSPAAIYLINDVEAGWAGASGCREGIHIVSGTGSIAFGSGQDEKTARCGGWHEFFGDEGSCYWVGRETMSLYTKEADGRIEKGPLYRIISQEMQLAGSDMFVEKLLNEVISWRDKVASFQRYTLLAAQEGDTAAAKLYQRAAGELVQMVAALKKQLLFTPGNKITVTYSGGLFHAGEWILEPLRNRLHDMDCELCSSKSTAVEGALVLAIQYYNNERK